MAPTLRKNAILTAANEHFAHYGFRGASLRDIARDAGVSLTLLNHHFGSKLQLLCAVIDDHRQVLDERINVLQAVVHAGPGTYNLRQLIEAWVQLGFETAAKPDGETFLRLVTRVMDDPTEEAAQVIRDKLDDAALVFIDCLQGCFPHISRHEAICAYIYTSAALLKFLVGSKRLFRLARTSIAHDAKLDDPARMVVFLVAGIEATLAAA